MPGQHGAASRSETTCSQSHFGAQGPLAPTSYSAAHDHRKRTVAWPQRSNGGLPFLPDRHPAGTAPSPVIGLVSLPIPLRLPNRLPIRGPSREVNGNRNGAFVQRTRAFRTASLGAMLCGDRRGFGTVVGLALGAGGGHAGVSSCMCPSGTPAWSRIRAVAAVQQYPPHTTPGLDFDTSAPSAALTEKPRPSARSPSSVERARP